MRGTHSSRVEFVAAGAARRQRSASAFRVWGGEPSRGDVDPAGWMPPESPSKRHQGEGKLELQSAINGWTRRTVLDGPQNSHLTETWEHRGKSHRVDVTVGKALDVLSLKGTSLAEIREYAGFLGESARRMYAAGSPRNVVKACPCCGRSSEAAAEAMQVFSVAYVRCADCGHVFVREQPAQSVLDELFSESARHSDEYTSIDPAAQEFRVRHIALPKLEWGRAQFQRVFGRSPASLLDIGAGGGHFVAAAARAGMLAHGYERSTASRAFARAAFGLELRATDFLADEVQSADMITFWGLLEYVPEPRTLLAAARRRLSGEGGMLVIEVPRFNCVGSAVQQVDGAVVARHMDPTTHVNCFTDASLCTALDAEGFRPVAAWYFGMDVYELFVQIALRLDDEGVLEKLVPMLNASQAALDHGRQCDDLIIAAVPVA